MKKPKIFDTHVVVESLRDSFKSITHWETFDIKAINATEGGHLWDERWPSMGRTYLIGGCLRDERWPSMGKVAVYGARRLGTCLYIEK